MCEPIHFEEEVLNTHTHTYVVSIIPVSLSLSLSLSLCEPLHLEEEVLGEGLDPSRQRRPAQRPLLTFVQIISEIIISISISIYLYKNIKTKHAPF
jgi:hypothetical protein